MYKFGISILCILLFVEAKCSKLKEVFVDIGQNLTVPCPILKTKDVMWVREQEKEEKMTVLENGSLFISEVDRNDSGNYSCIKENVVNSDVRSTIHVSVRSPPPPLINVSVRPSTILALILWDVQGNGGYPIINFTAQYRLAYSGSNWLPISPNHITPNSRQIEVYKLTPNTTYEFRIWATNQLGRGEITEVIGTTLSVYQEQELARHLLEGADKFDTRVWAVAVGIVMGTLVLLGFGTCFLLYQECKITPVTEEQEIIELVPNIILNPGFDGNQQNEQMPADENSNNETPLRLNNNTVVQPRNV
ncbi:contactin-3 [Aethina tumida]|uniref:contactin-3 n=1 Tax=Aethina tumida TaxID=116153 RepID=UPI00096AE958|nr:contactin-3 [Aethina tumida]XP_049819898.1 contactin-3 [Aethina tumida]